VSYEVLALKWRPQTFDEVVGQDHITRTLRRAVELQRLSHAYLFSGPRGCGKTSTARILAKVINCLDLKDGNPCNACDSCLGVINGRNLDVMEIDGASHTGVNEVRDLQESIGYVPSQFKNKIYIIDEVHMLSTHAFNALLKTLEEPPPHVYFVFATTAPHKIPDTIKSRCQRHNFKRLEVRDIAGHLEKIGVEEKVRFEKDALRLLARKAEGSMRDGQSLLDQCITASSGDVTTQAVREILGLLDQEMILRFIKTIAEGDPTAVLKELDSAIHEGVDLEELVNALVDGFRDLMLLAVPGDLSDLVFRSKDEVFSMRELLSKFELGDLVTIVERFCSLGPRLKTASDPRILLESVLVDLALLDRQVAIRDLIAKLEGSGGSGGGEAKGRGREAGESGGRRDRPADRGKAGAVEENASGAGAVIESFPLLNSAGERSVSDEEQPAAGTGQAGIPPSWESFVTQVRQKKVTLGVCLISGVLESIEGDTVRLRFPKGCAFQREQVEEPANKKFLRGATKKYFGRELEIACLGGDEGRESREPRKKTKESASAEGSRESDAETSPLFKKILDDFDGEIVRYPK
jgi:DNA polymerase-3 subunit gamma/tau